MKGYRRTNEEKQSVLPGCRHSGDGKIRNGEGAIRMSRFLVASLVRLREREREMVRCGDVEMERTSRLLGDSWDRSGGTTVLSLGAFFFVLLICNGLLRTASGHFQKQ